ncbi:putative hemicentin-1-like [Triplophysa rosa]|uniref:Hemicentin-1-like n=1 Tax=Triplophysa rosa TaxID=992332 RepID=A0A9W7TTF4_TRIRA|nr:putative hemicentin-1-like [Triplophysa rosa]
MMSQTENLTILLALLLSGMLAKENPQPIFRALGGELEMGFCFGDYIAMYRITAEGRELLGESSTPVSPPEAFKGRINITGQDDGLLGLKIMNLQFSDSGSYIRECKTDEILENHHTHLYVCGEEISQQDMSLTPGTGANLLCKVGASEASQTTVKWYTDVHITSLFLDTKISLEPLQEDFKGHVKVSDKGSLLHVSDDLIKDRPHFVCLVMDGEQCMSFQTIALPEEPDIKSIYRSVGENVSLTCSVDHLRQNYWETPFGPVNSSKPVSFKETTGSQIFVSNNMKIGHYPLVIRSLSSNHSGTYKCFSTFLVEDYIMNVCPVHASSNVSFSTEDKNVSLTCRYISELQLGDKTDSVSILWLQNSNGEDVQIMDSEDPSLSMPKDLEGRVTYSKKDSSLVITNPKEEDSGTYWCVVLLDNTEYAASENNDNNNLMEASNDQDEEHEWFTDEELRDMCLYRQVTNLSFQITNIESKSNLTIYAVCGGVIALLGLIGIVVGIKMRAKKNSVI